MMRLMSPRKTAPYHTLDSSASVTSPSTVAPGTIQALEWIVGPFLSRAGMPVCPVGNESGSICIGQLTSNSDKPRAGAQPADIWRQRRDEEHEHQRMGFSSSGAWAIIAAACPTSLQTKSHHSFSPILRVNAGRDCA